MSGYECDICGLAECDLPDGVDPEFLYEREGGKTWCIVHIDADVRALLADLVGGAQSPLPPLELPGTWEEADFLGGAPDTYQ